MKRLLNFSTLLLIGVLLFSSCCRSGKGDVENPYTVKKGDLKVNSVIQGMTTRTVDDTWESGDAIGVFAVNAGQTLSTGSIYDNNANRKYTTAGGNAFSSMEGVTVPTSGAIDIYSYYPYDAAQSGTEVAYNTSNQSDLGAIDLLYSNNVKNVTKDNSIANLVFRHRLTMVVFEITSESNVISEASTVRLNEVIVDGKMNLADGVVTNGSALASPAASIQEVTPAKEYQARMILPPQKLTGKKIGFVLNGKSYEYQMPAFTTESGYMYVVPVTYTKEGTITITNATILPWETGVGPTDPIVINPEEGGGVTPPAVAKEITIEATSHSIAGDAGSVSVSVVADPAVSWSAVRNDTWLTVTPASGTGNGTLTISATENTTGIARTGTVTVTATSVATTGMRATGESVTITITQAAKGVTPDPDPTPDPTPDGNLLFPGSDFEDWNAFLGSLNKFGLKHAVQSKTGGINGSSALHINGSSVGTDGQTNPYCFTVQISDFGTRGIKKVSFYINGTSSRSISINAQTGDSYNCFNLGEIGTTDVEIQPEAKNAYAGTIDTQGKWVKVTLNLSTINLENNKYGDSMAFKIGGNKDNGTAWDVKIDDITWE